MSPAPTDAGSADTAVPPPDAPVGMDATTGDAGGGPTCGAGLTVCNGTCIDTTSDDAHCGSCTIACGTGGTCVSGTCQGGLFGACTANTDCNAVPGGLCVGPTHGDTTGLPGGLCTTACTTGADCGDGADCVAVGTDHYCVPTCDRGTDCRAGYSCLPQPGAGAVCMPVCATDAQCGDGAYCNVWTGFCQTSRPSPSDPGADDGAPCDQAPDGTSNCRGTCDPAWAHAPDGTSTPTGYVDGTCQSYCSVGPEWGGPLSSFPPSACPSGSVCVPTEVPVTVGDLGTCTPECRTDADCREGYACKHGPRPTDAFTDGYCAPIDCNDGAHSCPANYYCESGYDPAHPTAGRCHPANIQHVVLLVQENHTFDSYFGHYCTAAAGSNPTCTRGPSCCEAAPATVSGVAPLSLTDSANYARDRHHEYACEICQIDGGAMDKFVTGGCPGGSSLLPPSAACSSSYTFAVADAPTLDTYWNYADNGALADRYFQPIVGGTASNDMYLAVAHYEFRDNDVMPDAYGSNCETDRVTHPPGGYTELPGRTIADVLLDRGVTFATYADGYGDAVDAAASCTDAMHSSCACATTYASDCRESYLYETACLYDAADVPFEYYRRFQDDPHTMLDYESHFLDDVDAGRLPDFAYVKFRTSRNEHPNWSYISDGEGWVDQVVSAIEGSPIYRDNTLILLTWDEGGGFYDHVAPPASVETYPSDDPSSPSMAGAPIPYGTRVPMLAIGRFARVGTVSHVQMEHSSIVRFLEFLFVGPSAVGTLGGRDAVVNNIGSMLKPSAVGVTVP